MALPRTDFRSPRLHVEAALKPGAEVALDKSQAHYLRNVLRLKAGDAVLVFNGRDGEWRATLATAGKPAAVALSLSEQVRKQGQPLDLHYLFAPLKHERLDYMVQKAVEMGVSRLQPVLTRHTQVERVNLDRMRANAIEAAEQCGIMSIPEITSPIAFSRVLAARKPDRLLVFCDEGAEAKDPVAALANARQSPSAMLPLTMSGGDNRQPIALLIGPEGGFSEDERAALLKQPNMVRLSLGPRILRADTAAVAALALVQAVLGDGR
jgi:16S rRNA (uracil1498-N3)-methyltransferase